MNSMTIDILICTAIVALGIMTLILLPRLPATRDWYDAHKDDLEALGWTYGVSLFAWSFVFSLILSTAIPGEFLGEFLGDGPWGVIALLIIPPVLVPLYIQVSVLIDSIKKGNKNAYWVKRLKKQGYRVEQISTDEYVVHIG